MNNTPQNKIIRVNRWITPDGKEHKTKQEAQAHLESPPPVERPLSENGLTQCPVCHHNKINTTPPKLIASPLCRRRYKTCIRCNYQWHTFEFYQGTMLKSMINMQVAAAKAKDFIKSFDKIRP